MQQPSPPLSPQRRTTTRERVLSAAASILRRHGYSRLTMEGVAARSGVAKTTLYRSWPTKASLCMDLYLDVAGRELPVADSGDVSKDLRKIAETVLHLQTRTVAGPAFIGLIAEAQVNPRTRRAFLAEFAQRRRVVTREVLRRAIDRGQIDAGTDIDLVIDALGGAMTFRLLQGHAPLNSKFIRALVTLLLEGCKRKTRGRKPS